MHLSHIESSRVLQIALLFAVGAALTGCNSGSGSRPVSKSIWQTQVQTYVEDQANGDINSLRNVEIAPGQPGFRAFSHDRPEQSKDVAGVLVGVHALADQMWYVYLVGDIDRESIIGMHLAAVSMNANQFQWRIGVDAPNGFAAYRANREKVWREKHGEAEPPRTAFSFPSAGDNFTMQANGDVITVRENASGAQWTLAFETQPPAANAS